MDYNSLKETIFKKLHSKLSESSGLSVFSSERSKFENWLQVEVAGILLDEFGIQFIPEKNTIDLYTNEWSIELKVVATCYKNTKTKNKGLRAVTNTVNSLLKDIDTLKNIGNQAAVIFVVFPIETNNEKDWNYHENRIRSRIAELNEKYFMFNNGVRGCLFVGRVSK